MLHRRQPRHATLDTRNMRLGAIASFTAVLLSVIALARSPRGLEMLAFLDFYVGVFSLVSLTATVALGLLASERVLLAAPNRVRVQLAHRIAAATGVACLTIHIAMKIDRVSALGLAAAALVLMAATSGVLRGRFASTAKPGLWRVLHGASYLAWPMAIMHGLSAGRAPAGWVTWAYLACLAAVGAALLVRLWATLIRPPAVPEWVQAPEVSAEAPAEPATTTVPAASAVNAPVDLAQYRRAG